MTELDERLLRLSPTKRALYERRLQQTQARSRASQPVAIIGLGCRFPGADGPARFWQMLAEGRDAVVGDPSARWDASYFDPDPDAPGKHYLTQLGLLDAIETFDAPLFGVTPSEAESMDPQQRVLLEVAWEALEHAGVAPDSLSGSPTGVFVGAFHSGYAELRTKRGDVDRIDAYTAPGELAAMIAGRLSYTLGLQGPSVRVDTLCSSSLVAVHLACQSLRADECTMALAGGVNVLLNLDHIVSLSRARAFAKDGRCKTFDASADGFVPAEGCGVVVLKLLSRALADGDDVLAVVRGSAVNHDGRSSSLTAPNGRAQELVIRAALASAGVLPSEVGYVEAHGTGTSLGDPIEAEAIDGAFGDGRTEDNPLLLGSVKTNIGHSDAASGIAGLIKVVLSLAHGAIPPHLHFETLNPHITPGRFAIPTALTPWVAGGPPRIAGINAFGLSGTNAHVIVAEAPPFERAGVDGMAPERPRHFLRLSALSDDALRALAARHVDALAHVSDEALADYVLTANTGRALFELRQCVHGRTRDELVLRLATFARGGATKPRNATLGRRGESRVAFLFSGVGTQYAGMGKALYDEEPVFRAMLDRCASGVADELDRPLLDVLYGRDVHLLDEVAYMQPAIFSIQVALTALWRSWGVEPAAVLGHSLGEFAAAVAAGALSLDEGLRIVLARGRLIQSLPRGGGMHVVFAPEATVSATLARVAGASAVAIAAVNGPENVVISGADRPLADVLEALRAAGIATQKLVVSHALHSPLLDPILDDFERAAASTSARAPHLTFVSNLTGRALARDAVLDADYWRRHLRAPVRFADGMRALHAQGIRSFLEIGPHTTVVGMGRAVVGEEGSVWAPSLRRDADGKATILDSLAALHTNGVPFDPKAFDEGHGRRRGIVPTYPFQRRRHWRDSSATPAKAAPLAPHATPWAPVLAFTSARGERFANVELDATTAPWLLDHRIQDAVVISGTTVLELVRRAAGGSPQLEDIRFLRPLVLRAASGAHLRVQVAVSAKGDRFEVFGAGASSATWSLHATGAIRREPHAVAAPHALAEARRACTDARDVRAVYARLEEQGLAYGPAFRGLAELWVAGDSRSALARLVLPDPAAGTSFDAHPALVDAGLQVMAALFSETSATHVPVRLGRIDWSAPLDREVWCHVRLEGLVGEMRLFSTDGTLALAMTEIEVAPASMEALAELEAAPGFTEVRWVPAPPQVSTNSTRARRFALLGGGKLATVLAARLTSLGHAPIVLARSAAHRIERGTVDAIVDLGALERPHTADATPSDALASCASALALVQQLARSRVVAPLFFVTAGAQTVRAGDGAPGLLGSPLAALARVMGLEHQELEGGSIDLDPARHDVAAEADMLARALLAGDHEDRQAFRDGARFVARIEPARDVPHGSEPTALRADATYLVTGGLGGLGLAVAEWMIASGARHLVLVGRSEPKPDARKRLATLTAGGAVVIDLRVDVADAAAVQQLYAHIAANMPPLRGVVHAAGLVDDAAAAEVAWDRCARVLAPKIQGAWNLHVHAPALDFFTLFSSTSSVLGMPGQIAYAAGNAFMDALAHERRAAGLAATSINWGPWRDAGMAAGAPYGARLGKWGIRPMSPAAGVRALAAVHASGAAQVGVMIADWARVIAAFPGGRSPLLSSMADDPEGSAPRAVAQAASPAGSKLVEQLSEAPLDARHELALDYLRGCIAGVLGIDASVLGDQDEPLADAGIDSLRAVEVRNLLKVAFARPFPSTLLFEHPTLDSLARFLVDALVTPEAREDHAPPSIPPSLPSPVAASVPPPSSAVAPGARPRFSELRDRVERASHDEAAFVLSTRRSR